MTAVTRPASHGTTLVFDKPDAEKRIHICRICNKSFKRSEHCIRHQRAHTQEKPFSCRFCKRRYSRRDLVVRHERTLHAGEELGNDEANSNAANLHSSLTDADTIIVDAENQLPQLHSTELGPSSNLDPEQNDDYSEDAVNDNANGMQMDFDLPSMPESTAFSTTESHTAVQMWPAQGQARPSIHGLDQPASMLQSEERNEVDFALNTANLTHPNPFSNDNFNDLDFFDLFPGLPLDQLPNSSFPNNLSSSERFMPLEKASAIDSSSHHAAKSSIQDSFVAPLQADQNFGRPATPNKNHGTAQFEYNDSVNPRLPQIVKGVPPRQPLMVVTDQLRATLSTDLSSRLGAEHAVNIALPSSTSLQKCLRAFIDSCHVHLPFLHLHTFDLEHAPSPLVLSMCAVGALFRLERRVAASLYAKAELALENELSNPSPYVGTPNFLEDWVIPRRDSTTPEQRPLWVAQCKLLLTLFGGFSGDPAVIKKAIEGMGFLTNDYRSRINLAKSRGKSRDGQVANWHQWVYRETTKRICYAVFVISNLLTTTYGIPPAVSIVQDGEVEMPCDEALWDAPSEEQWQQRSATRERSVALNLRDAVARLMYGKEIDGAPSSCWNWAPFAAVLVMHGVSVQMWHIMQCTQSFSVFSVHAAIHDSLKALVTSQTEAALARCRALITRARNDQEQTLNEAEGPLLFNCLALLRTTYVRAFTGIGSADRMILLRDDITDIRVAIREYIASPQTRGAFITKAIARAFEGFLTPMKTGALLVQKTAALSWSIEHAIAGWDCGLFFTKWVYAMEKLQRQGARLEEAELQNMENVRTFLTEIGVIVDTQTSLAAEMSRHWASFYTDTWVWGITPRMGFILRELADLYEEAA